MKACAQGSRKAQFEVYKRYYKAMYNTAFRMLGNSMEAEDVMQESFLKAFQKIETYKGEVSFGSWLKKIVVNRSLDILKTKKALLSIDSVQEMSDEGSEEVTLRRDDLSPELVKNVIQELPEGYRVVLSLYLIEGYDHEEISSILNITESTSRTQYHRAKKKLATALESLKAVS